MFRWLVVCLACGCGRLNFELTTPDGSDGPVDVPAFTCPATYTTIDGGCYRAVKNSPQIEWSANEAVCEAEGGHLAVIDDHAELIRLTELLVANNIVDAAVGFSDRLVEGEFRTVTGAPLFLELGTGEPDGGTIANCGGIDSSVASFGMEDIRCDSANDYICEIDGTPADPTQF